MGSFPLAPMDLTMRLSTGVCLVLPPALLLAGLRAPSEEGTVLAAAATGCLLLYAGIWGWLRPSRFELTADSLEVVFPWRRLSIPRAAIAGARTLERGEFKKLYGLAFRVGAGGLWGGFGFLWTTKRGRVDMFISRIDSWVLVERRGAPDILISAEPAAGFVAALKP